LTLNNNHSLTETLVIVVFIIISMFHIVCIQLLRIMLTLEKVHASFTVEVR